MHIHSCRSGTLSFSSFLKRETVIRATLFQPPPPLLSLPFLSTKLSSPSSRKSFSAYLCYLPTYYTFDEKEGHWKREEKKRKKTMYEIHQKKIYTVDIISPIIGIRHLRFCHNLTKNICPRVLLQLWEFLTSNSLIQDHPTCRLFILVVQWKKGFKFSSKFREELGNSSVCVGGRWIIHIRGNLSPTRPSLVFLNVFECTARWIEPNYSGTSISMQFLSCIFYYVWNTLSPEGETC